VAGAGCPNSGEPRRGLAGGGLGKDLWGAMDRFGRLGCGEMSPVGGAPAARGYRPPRLAKPAMRTSGGGLCWPVSYWGARGGVGEAERPAGRVEAELVQAAGMAARRAWRSRRWGRLRPL
jgi:hypothetical protein